MCVLCYIIYMYFTNKIYMLYIMCIYTHNTGFLGGTSGKEPACQ